MQFANDIEPIVPRTQMPQINREDFADMLVFLGSHGVSFSAGYIDPATVFSHQEVDVNKALAMPPEVLAIPTLLSKDEAIIDGNHRWCGHFTNKTQMPFLRIETDFFSALKLLFQYPKCYEVK
jgi:hypothetical protein